MSSATSPPRRKRRKPKAREKAILWPLIAALWSIPMALVFMPFAQDATERGFKILHDFTPSWYAEGWALIGASVFAVKKLADGWDKHCETRSGTSDTRGVATPSDAPPEPTSDNSEPVASVDTVGSTTTTTTTTKDNP